MSQDFNHHHHHHQGIFSLTPPPINAPDESSQIRIREDNTNHKLRLQGLAHAPEGASASGMHPAVYETAGMLSEMLNFGGGHGGAGGVNAAGMQFFLADPQPRMLSPPPLTHVLLPTQQHEFMNWVDPEGGGGGGFVEGRGLSLSLSSPLEAAKAEEEMRMGGGGGGMMFFGSQGHHSQNQHVMHLQGYGIGHPSGHFGSALAAPASSLGAVNSMRNSKFLKPAQELLEEFCSVGRGNLKKSKFSRYNSINSTTGSGGGAGTSSSNSAKDSPVLLPSERMEHQRRKVKLLTMLDEMERRYSQYCEQMQMVVNSYDVVMGYGAAIPYTALAQKAMSRHFRCLKDAIQAQLKHSCELLGDKDVSVSTGLTKGETPRLKILEQSLRQQRAFHQMGMMEQEAWRPQRGLPERSVNILRAWLFEHFLHPYPSDADKHMLGRQTGLSRNQVSNWFINARVRLWKPMVEDMYQQESKDGGGEDDDDDHPRQPDQEDVDDEEEEDDEDRGKRSSDRDTVNSNAQTSMSAATSTTPPKRSLINAPDNDASYFAINGASLLPAPAEFAGVWPLAADDGVAGPTVLGFGATTAVAGDVSLTLGLRHSAAGGGEGGLPEKSGFSFRDFGS